VDRTFELIPLDRLRRALALLLDYYPHLTGRFQLNEADHTTEITDLNSGALLLSATCTNTLDDLRRVRPIDIQQAVDADGDDPRRLLLSDLPAGGNALLAPFDPSPEAVYRDPIFAIQHTRFACGSVSLGIRLPHAVCDSDGFFQLVRDLAELYRGLGTDSSSSSCLAQPPNIRSFMSELTLMAVEERQHALEITPSFLGLKQDVSMQSSDAASSNASQPPHVAGRVLRFGCHELGALKAHAADADGRGWVSTFEALAAHLYQRVYVARVKLLLQNAAKSTATLSSNPNGGFLTPVNWRTADRLNLAPRYFANAILCPHFSLPHDVLLHATLSTIARAVHNHLAMPTKEDVHRTLRWVAAQPDKSRVTLGFNPENGGFMISQWCKFDMYGSTVFDQDPKGQPIHAALVAPPFTSISLIDGLGYLVATPQQATRRSTDESTTSGSSPSAIDVYLALSEPVWKTLDDDLEFRKFRRQVNK
jgi:hypothetical protein